MVHPTLPEITEWEFVSESTKVKCLAVVESLGDQWCEDTCNSGIESGVASCPVQSCVCDWDGTWPDEESGFAGWDLGSLGIPKGTQHTHPTLPSRRARPWILTIPDSSCFLGSSNASSISPTFIF